MHGEYYGDLTVNRPCIALVVTDNDDDDDQLELCLSSPGLCGRKSGSFVQGAHFASVKLFKLRSRRGIRLYEGWGHRSVLLYVEET